MTNTRTLLRWFERQHGKRPSAKTLTQLRQQVEELDDALIAARYAYHATLAWDDKWQTAQYTRNWMETRKQ